MCVGLDMRNTTNSSYVEVKEMTPDLGYNSGNDLDEIKTRCKYVLVVSKDKYVGYYVIPLNALNKTNKGLWVKKGNLLAEITGMEFIPVIGYLDKNKIRFDGTKVFYDHRLRKHRNQRSID